MLKFIVYGETIEQAQAVGATFKSALSKALASSFIGSSVATPEIKGAKEFPGVQPS